MKNKKGSLWHQIILHLVLIGLIFAMFLIFTAGRVDSRDVKQQVLEKQLALLIDSAPSGTTLVVSKMNRNGLVQDVLIEKGRIFVHVNDLRVSKGYPYISKYEVSVSSDEENFYIGVT